MDDGRRILFVAGSGRSGTSTLAGLVAGLGLHVPQPVVAADESNPAGFSEPRWVVDLHDRLLDDVLVQPNDSRPRAWALTARRGADPATLAQVTDWLRGQLSEAPELVVKDPRLAWFVPMWREAARRCEAEAVFATMLRPPPEVVGSKQRYYANRLGTAHLTASWVNLLLHTELATRDAPRAFVRYDDLLTDWRPVVEGLGSRLGLAAVRSAPPSAWAALDGFVDPSLRRVRQDWADLRLPGRLEAVARGVWETLDSLVDAPDSSAVRDSAGTPGVFDELLAAYDVLYAESEAIARSTAVAGRLEVQRQAASTTPTSWADRVPHRLRARVPAPLRRGVRRLLPRRPGR